MRTEKSKEQRKEQDAKNQQNYLIVYDLNQESINICKKCGDKKLLKNFVRNFTFRNICKECHRNKVKTHRNENRDKVQKLVERNGKRSSIFTLSLKKDKPCERCKKFFLPHSMDFHHVSDKTWTISKLYGKSKVRILEEVSKCVLICANCHRNETQNDSKNERVFKNRKLLPDYVYKTINSGDPTRACKVCKETRHKNDFSVMHTGYLHSYCIPCKRKYERENSNKRKRSTKEFLKEIKEQAECSDCKNQFSYWQMDYDHITSDKLKSINKMQTGSLDELKKEISKCELVCANCHRNRTQNWKRGVHKCNCGYKSKSASDSKNHELNCDQAEKIGDFSIEEEKLIIHNSIVESTTIEEARDFLNKYHYAGYGRSAKKVYAVKYNNEILSVIKFSPPVRKEVATSMGWKPTDVLELDRFCIRPKWQVKNLASKIMSKVIGLVKNDFPEIVILISFSDPSQGHVGTLYRASNWTHVGQTSSSYIYTNQNGDEINKKVVYDEAKRLGLKERDHAKKCKYIKQSIGVKDKFVYELR